MKIKFSVIISMAVGVTVGAVPLALLSTAYAIGSVCTAWLIVLVSYILGKYWPDNTTNGSI
jgi:hypothetical protein